MRLRKVNEWLKSIDPKMGCFGLFFNVFSFLNLGFRGGDRLAAHIWTGLEAGETPAGGGRRTDFDPDFDFDGIPPAYGRGGPLKPPLFSSRCSVCLKHSLWGGNMV